MFLPIDNLPDTAMLVGCGLHLRSACLFCVGLRLSCLEMPFLIRLSVPYAGPLLEQRQHRLQLGPHLPQVSQVSAQQYQYSPKVHTALPGNAHQSKWPTKTLSPFPSFFSTTPTDEPARPHLGWPQHRAMSQRSAAHRIPAL